MKNLLRGILLAAAACCVLALGTPGAEAAGPNPVVVMETSAGRIMIMLYTDKAPVTVENFLKYVDAGFYDNTIFHRIVRQAKRGADLDKANLMNVVQGGGYDYPLERKRPIAPPIPCESSSGFSNIRGTIAMARAVAADSATSEFFFNTKDNSILDYKGGARWGNKISDANMGYCAFGKVIRGMEVIDEIQKVETMKKGMMEDIPKTPVYLLKAYRAK